jgi:hypothetical protein
LGYISRGRIKRLVKNNILPPLEFSNIEQCIDCIKGKYVKQIKRGANRSTTTLEIIHTDISGPFLVKSVDGYDSFITFTDDYSRYGYIYPIKEMSEALDKFNICKAEVENQHDKRIRDFYFGALRSLVVLSFPQLVSFSSVFPKPLSETLRRSSDGRISV